MAGALDAAHSLGLVHRDVKPGNVLIAKAVGSTSGEHVYLSDFGLTKRTSSDSGLTNTGQFVGTLEYAAPEQFEGKPLDPRTDVYSLGCLLYECITGQPPFQRESDAALMYAHLMESAPAPTSVRPELPKAIDAVVSRAMAKKPSDRYESAGAFAAGVRRALPLADGSGVGGPTPGRRSRTVIAALGAVAAVVVGIVVTLSLAGGGAGGPDAQTRSPSAALGPPLNSVVEIDPSTGAIDSTISGLEVDVGPSIVRARMAVGEGGVWVLDGLAVTHVDPDSGAVERRIPYPGAGLFGVRSIVVGLGALAITDVVEAGATSSGALSRIDPATDRLRTIPFPLTEEPTGLAIGAGAIWESFGGGTLLRIDPRTFRIEGRFDLGGSLDVLAADDEGVWVGDTLASTVRFVDPHTGAASTPITVSGVSQLAADGGSVWVLDRGAGTVAHVDPTSGTGPAIRVGDDPTDMVAGLGALWICDGGGALWRVDLVTEEVTTIEIGSPLAAIAIDAPHGTLWALVFESTRL